MVERRFNDGVMIERILEGSVKVERKSDDAVKIEVIEVLLSGRFSSQLLHN
jgi:DNA-binding protein